MVELVCTVCRDQALENDYAYGVFARKCATCEGSLVSAKQYLSVFGIKKRDQYLSERQLKPLTLDCPLCCTLMSTVTLSQDIKEMAYCRQCKSFWFAQGQIQSIGKAILDQLEICANCGRQRYFKSLCDRCASIKRSHSAEARQKNSILDRLSWRSEVDDVAGVKGALLRIVHRWIHILRQS